MKLYRYIHRAPVRVIKIKRRRLVLQLKRDLQSLKIALAQEKDETKEMLDTYKRFTTRRASRVELKEANKQLKDIMKGLGLGVFVVLPFAPLTIPLVVKLGKFVNIDVLPSAFNESPSNKK